MRPRLRFVTLRTLLFLHEGLYVDSSPFLPGGFPARQQRRQCEQAVAMYSIPQQAVTNGYWKIEYFCAQPMASSRRVVRKEGLFAISLPIQGFVAPGVNVAHHQNPEKDSHLHQTRHAEFAVDRAQLLID